MISTLPNARWLCLPSDLAGEDWMEKCQELDEALGPQGLELAEESVVLRYEGVHCQVCRPVIGPKRPVSSPFQLIDWKAAPVQRKLLTGQKWEEIFTQVQEHSRGKTPSFMLYLRRRRVPELILEIEALFYE